MATSFRLGTDSLPYIEKDPDALLDYEVDWTSLLDGDTITGTPEWTIASGLTKDSQTNTTTTATVWLSGGAVDGVYLVACKITTAAGRIDECSFNVRVKNK